MSLLTALGIIHKFVHEESDKLEIIPMREDLGEYPAWLGPFGSLNLNNSVLLSCYFQIYILSTSRSELFIIKLDYHYSCD